MPATRMRSASASTRRRWPATGATSTRSSRGCDARRRRRAAPTIEPFAYAAIATDPMALRRCAELFAADQFPAQPRARRAGHARWATRRSASATSAASSATRPRPSSRWSCSSCTTSSRFEIVAFDNGWDDGSTLRRRMDAAFDEIVDISALPDDAAARAIAERRIDILVNLNGWFGLGRTGVFARRPAPVQVNYLGFPGTLGAPYLDVIVADAQTDPRRRGGRLRRARACACRTATSPTTASARSPRAPTRAELGLPDDARRVRVLQQHLQDHAGDLRVVDAHPGRGRRQRAVAAAGQRRRHAQPARRGRGARRRRRRACTSRRASASTTISRATRCADLFLDTLPYNAHTTASDALWAGLPVLSCRGTTFPGRVGASLLHALDLADELLVDDVAGVRGARHRARARPRASRARARAPRAGAHDGAAVRHAGVLPRRSRRPTRRCSKA